MGPLALAPMFPQLIESFHSNLTDVVQFTGVAILVLGFSNFIWYYVPFTYPAASAIVNSDVTGSR